MRRRESSLEVVLRIRSATGMVESEWTIRGDRVQLESYFPSGEHAAPPLTISLDLFVETLHKRRAEREAEDAASR